MVDERERYREECYEDLQALRSENLPERAFRLLEKILARLDRIETGSFPMREMPTEPERKSSSGGYAAVREMGEEPRKVSGGWKNKEVIRALEEGHASVGRAREEPEEPPTPKEPFKPSPSGTREASDVGK
jgi:hypothetical protein